MRVMVVEHSGSLIQALSCSSTFARITEYCTLVTQKLIIISSLMPITSTVHVQIGKVGFDL